VLRTVLLSKTTPAAVLSDPRTILFAGCSALLVGLITGIAPMHQAMRGVRTLVDDLKSGAREGTYQRSRTRIVLLVAQAALSVVLLVGAGLFVRSLDRLRGARLGYDVDPVALVNLNMRGVTLDSAHSAQLRQRLLDVATTIPGVTHATFNASLPFWSTWSMGLYVAGIDTVSRLGEFDVNAVSPGYFATFGTRIVTGRAFTDADSPAAPKVMVVSQGMAHALWPGRAAIGQCVRINADTMPCTTVVGVSEDIRHDNITGDSATYMYYLPATQVNESSGLALRTSGTAANSVESIRRRLQREMPGASYVTVTPFSDIVGRQMQSWKLGATMFAAFGVLALALAAIGLYSVIAYNVVQRTHEMGVRVALGAQVRDVVLLVVRDGLKLGVVGLVIGAAIARGAAHWVEPLLYKESPSDPVVFGSVTAVLLAVAIAASWVPAQRAARVDPQVALRTD
jgi:predicted permease